MSNLYFCRRRLTNCNQNSIMSSYACVNNHEGVCSWRNTLIVLMESYLIDTEQIAPTERLVHLRHSDAIEKRPALSKTITLEKEEWQRWHLRGLLTITVISTFFNVSTILYLSNALRTFSTSYLVIKRHVKLLNNKSRSNKVQIKLFVINIFIKNHCEDL